VGIPASPRWAGGVFLREKSGRNLNFHKLNNFNDLRYLYYSG